MRERTMTFSTALAWLGLCCVLAVAGCDKSVRLAMAPTVFVNAESYPEDEIPQRLRRVDPTIFYVTDRMPVTQDGEVVGYSFQRSDSMAYGETWVSFGDIKTWPELVRHSASKSRGRLPALTLKGVDELVRFSATPLPFELRDGQIQPLPDAAATYNSQMSVFKAAIATELRQSEHKEILVYIHGYNNDFEDGLATLTNIWHYTGRRGVPISYSWPAGNRGLFKYFKDTEAGEFSIYHLKEFLRAIGSIPDVEKIHIVAHSRGTDVATSALREMMIFERGAGRDPHRSLKMGTLIMAAPDLDLGVARQRLMAEGFAGAFDQINVYTNPNDGALGVAQLIGKGPRFGRIKVSDLRADEVISLARARNVHFINVEKAGGQLGHAYFRKNPGVVSDIILTLRTGAFPGTTQRPLENVTGNFWTIHRNYPFVRVTEQKPETGR